MCATVQQAEHALELLTAMLADLGLEPKASKTRIVHLEEGGKGFDFLGFHTAGCGRAHRATAMCSSLLADPRTRR
jgi:RNA-directed DNA polymerase